MQRSFSQQLLTMVFVALTSPGVALAGDDLAPSRQAALMVSVLPYDRHFKSLPEGRVTIAVLTRDGNVSSATYGLDMAAALRDFSLSRPLGGMAIQVLSIAYSDADSLEEVAARTHLSALYVCPGLGDAVSAISAVARRHRILTFSSRESEVRSQLSVGLVRRGTKASLLLNVRAAMAEGADLEPELLAVGEVLR